MFRLIANAMGRDIPPTQAQVYYELLNDIPLEFLQHAVLRALQEVEGNYVPSIATIRRFASEAQWGQLPSWGDEWERVTTCCRKFGRMRWDDTAKVLGPFTTKIVRQIGWSNICDSEMPGVQMSQFKELYTHAATVESQRRCLSEELRPGSSKNFLTTQPIRRIGAATNGSSN